MNIVWGNVSEMSIYAAMVKPSLIPPSTYAPTPADYSNIYMMLLGLFVGMILAPLLYSEWALLALLGALGMVGTGTDEREESEVRGMLRGMILAQPGVHYRWLKRNSGKSNGTVAYHLRKLEAEGEIRSERDGILKRYYPVKKTKRLRPLSLQRAILDVLKSNPGTSQIEIAYLLDESKQNIYYHIKKLIQEGSILMEKDDSGHTMYYLAPEKNGL